MVSSVATAPKAPPQPLPPSERRRRELAVSIAFWSLIPGTFLGILILAAQGAEAMFPGMVELILQREDWKMLMGGIFLGLIAVANIIIATVVGFWLSVERNRMQEIGGWISLLPPVMVLRLLCSWVAWAIWPLARAYVLLLWIVGWTVNWPLLVFLPHMAAAYGATFDHLDRQVGHLAKALRHRLFGALLALVLLVIDSLLLFIPWIPALSLLFIPLAKGWRAHVGLHERAWTRLIQVMETVAKATAWTPPALAGVTWGIVRSVNRALVSWSDDVVAEDAIGLTGDHEVS